MNVASQICTQNSDTYKSSRSLSNTGMPMNRCWDKKDVSIFVSIIKADSNLGTWQTIAQERPGKAFDIILDRSLARVNTKNEPISVKEALNNHVLSTMHEKG